MIEDNNKNIDPVLREKELDGYRSIAQKIRNRLMQLENASDKDKKRWVWELLQNAVDAANGQDVDIEVVLGENFVKFRHNGGVFTPRNVTNLVHQISSKEGTESIGRFGTGFLTTHTLSRIVEVEGVFIPSNDVNENSDSFYKFNLILNRTGNTERELVEGIASAWDTYKREKIEKPVAPFWTTFNYINSDIEIAKETINDFETYVCYSLAFVKKIKSVTLNKEVENQIIKFSISNDVIISDNLKVVTFKKKINKKTTEISLLIVENDDVNLAIEIRKQKNGDIFILPIQANIPRLFCAYPLIGSEQFYFPYVINSIKFNPTQERDALYLKGETNQSKPNKELLLQATELYKIATNYITEEKWKDLFVIAKHQIPPQSDEFDTNWYIENIQKSIREQLLSIPIVENSFGALLPIIKNEKFKSFAYFPHAPLFEIREQIRDFASELFSYQLPQKQHIHEWYNILWDKGLQATIKDLTRQISLKKDLKTLKATLKNEISEINWLNSFVSFVEENQPELLDEYAILPNQYGNFKLKKELYEDKDKIHPKLKDILKVLGEDWYEEFLHLGITNAKMKGKIRSNENLIQSFNSIIDRDEFYMFEDYDYNQLIEKKVDKSIADKLNVIKGQLFTRKDKYINKLKEITGNQYTLIESITDLEARQIRNSIFEILSLFPEKENDYRTKMYQIVKEFDNDVPEKSIIQKLPENTWQKADVWILKRIISEIEDFETIEKLCEHLKQNISEEFDTNQTLAWLNNLYIFLLENEKLELLAEKEVYPDQNGNFHKKSELFQDIDIAEELKDILEEFEKEENPEAEIVGWRSILLDKNITAFNEKHKLQPKTVKDISEKINLLIQEIDFEENENAQNILFHLISFTNNEEYEIQEKIWQLLRPFYYERVPENLTILGNSNDFDWANCKHECIDILLTDVTNCRNVEKIDSKLTGATTGIEWLHNLIDFVQKDENYKTFLNNDELAILPNQNGILRPKSTLYLDDGTIDEELKEILRYLQPEWVNELLDKRIYIDLQNRTRSFDHIANEIDIVFKKLSGEDKETEEFKNAFSILFNWFEDNKENTTKINSFEWTFKNKEAMFVSAIGDREEKEAVLNLAKSGNAKVFSQIANNNAYTKEHYKFIAENSDKIQNLINTQNNQDSFVTKQIVLSEQLDFINQKTGQKFNSIDDVIETLNNVELFEEEPQEGSPRTQKGHPKYIDIQAIKNANIEARQSILDHLSKKSGYDVSQYTKITNTILKIKKKGIDIYIVVKAANNGVIYLSEEERNILKNENEVEFSELWVYKKGNIYDISLGKILEKWKAKIIEAELFDFKKR